jgi:hypothetical protein
VAAWEPTSKEGLARAQPRAQVHVAAWEPTPQGDRVLVAMEDV